MSRHCGERSDEAIQLSRGTGLLRCARNDGAFSRRMFFVRAMPSQSHEPSQSPDLRQMTPAVVFPAAITIIALQAIWWVSLRSTHPANFERTKERKAERRKTRVRTSRTLRCGARFAKRARLAAFHHGSCLREYLIPKAQPQAMLRGKRDACTGGGSPRSAGPVAATHLACRS